MASYITITLQGSAEAAVKTTPEEQSRMLAGNRRRIRGPGQLSTAHPSLCLSACPVTASDAVGRQRGTAHSNTLPAPEADCNGEQRAAQPLLHRDGGGDRGAEGGVRGGHAAAVKKGAQVPHLQGDKGERTAREASASREWACRRAVKGGAQVPHLPTASCRCRKLP